LASRRCVAVVTGSARGIGRRVALEPAERGYAVAANDLDAPEETLAELERTGADTLSVPGDVSDEGAVSGMVEAKTSVVCSWRSKLLATSTALCSST
jgi:NAD(P)-dependent dehydrogenase (short-subunit alcohol dehydrogenase family)